LKEEEEEEQEEQEEEEEEEEETRWKRSLKKITGMVIEQNIAVYE
jgi:hypothetical protein